ncbi:unnamed protein product [Soboliphyme baturini]|uniref:Uncharacterized protein n=1 Tax=Soboliphyme baturini TaxID=241478 RepID=A0A183IHT6_9BILA|nr:unnamed protein product [Soboliphyme baturini]
METAIWTMSSIQLIGSLISQTHINDEGEDHLKTDGTGLH